MTPTHADALVFFGATGDLAYKKVFPALQAMIRHGHLDSPIVGVAKSNWTFDQFKARVKDSLEKHGSFDASSFEKLCSLLSYIDGDYRDRDTYVKLREGLGAAKRPLHYLAIPPSMFATVIEGLAEVGCTNDARVVVEKPFGRNLASAEELNATLLRFFPEQAIFRIDHYLGKEPVQNLLYFRFANPHVEAIWNHQYIDSVQITMAEAFGVEGRGKFYEEAGALRDVVQNHMLQIIACLSMESPVGNDHESRRDERANVLQSIRPLEASDIVRGQFSGYKKEPGVAPNSRVETFAAARFFIDSPRWAGVPFYVRAGKCLAVTATEVVVYLKRPPGPVLDDPQAPLANYYRFRLSPHVVIALGTKVKKPGELMIGERIELIACHHSPDEMDPYERLLSDAFKGDTTLFARQDGVESSWRVVDPVLGDVTPLFNYEPNSWGPDEAAHLLGSGRQWHNPELEDMDI